MIGQLVLAALAQLCEDVRSARQWVRRAWARGAARHGRWWRRARLLMLVAAVYPVFVDARAAIAADPPKGGSAWFTWVSIKDSHGFEPWQYGLSLDTGGVTNMGAGVGSIFLNWAWDLWRLVVLIAAWGLDYVLQFRALELFRPVAQTLGTVLSSVVGQIGVAGTLAAFSILLAGIWIAKGRAGAGFGEIAMIAIVLGLLSTWVSNPVGKLADPNDGLIVQAQQIGSGLTSRMLTNPTGPATGYGEADGADSSQRPQPGPDPVVQARSVASQALLDTFVRTPHQLLNYGKPLDDGGKCQTAYDKTIKSSPYPIGDDKPREAVGDACGHDTDWVAENPQNSIIGAILMFPSGIFLMVFVVVLLVVTAGLTALALFEAAKLAIELLKGLLPGDSRAGIFVSVATMFAALAFLVVAVTAVGVLILTLKGVFASSGKTNPVVMYLLVDLVVFILLIWVATLLVKARKSGKKLGQRMAQSLAPKPVNLATGPSTAARVMNGARHTTAALQRRKMNASLSGSSSAGSAGVGGADKAQRGRMMRAAVVTGKVTKAGVAYTLGSPVAVPRATKAAKAAMQVRKEATRAKLAAAGKATKDYATEYATNTKKAGSFVATATGTRLAARGGAAAARAAGRAAAPHMTNLATATALRMGGPEGDAAADQTRSRGGDHSSTAPARAGDGGAPRRTPTVTSSPNPERVRRSGGMTDKAPAPGTAQTSRQRPAGAGGPGKPRPSTPSTEDAKRRQPADRAGQQTRPTVRVNRTPGSTDPTTSPAPAVDRQSTPMQTPTRASADPQERRRVQQQQREAQQRLRARLSQGRGRAGGRAS